MKTRLKQFLNAIGARAKLAQDEAEDWLVPGKFGVVYGDNNNANLFHIVFGAPAAPGIPSDAPLSAPKARAIRERMDGIKGLTANHHGETEFSYKLDRLPISAEAERFRDAIGLAKRRILTDEQRERLISMGRRFRKSEVECEAGTGDGGGEAVG